MPLDNKKSELNLAPQPASVEGLVKAINTASKQLNLYGLQHPNSHAHIGSVTAAVSCFVQEFENGACIFSPDTVIVNNHCFEASSGSRELYLKLRARAVTSVAFLGSLTDDETTALLTFLETEPTEIRHAGGPCTWMRERGVTRIVFTESTYTTGVTDEDSDPSSQLEAAKGKMDRAVASAVEWLCRVRKSTDTADCPSLDEVLSDPEAAAKLITEAVNMLHAVSLRHGKPCTAEEVISRMQKLLGASDWDAATAQVRSAVVRLPKDMRPEVPGFTTRSDLLENITAEQANKTARLDEVESMVHRFLSAPDVLRDLDALLLEIEPLFGANQAGLMSSWREELKPSSVLQSSALTLHALMGWATTPPEFTRATSALAGLLPRALEVGDVTSAMQIMTALVECIKCGDGPEWRAAGARSALSSIDRAALCRAVRSAVASSRDGYVEAAAVVIDAAPEIGPLIVDLMVAPGAEPLQDPIHRSLTQAGESARDVLVRCLNEGSVAAREAALGVLIDLYGAAVSEEIAQALERADEDFTIRALRLIPRLRIPLVADACNRALSSSSSQVRCAALEALGELGDDVALTRLMRTVERRGLSPDDVVEKIAAVRALGRIGRPEALAFLKQIARRRPLINAARYEPVRAAAAAAAAELDPALKARGKAA